MNDGGRGTLKTGIIVMICRMFIICHMLLIETPINSERAKFAPIAAEMEFLTASTTDPTMESMPKLIIVQNPTGYLPLTTVVELSH